METKLKSMFVAALTLAASTQKLGINLIRVAILVIFVWIGGLKFWNYEAEGIVPFVANSPFMSFFYTHDEHRYPYIPRHILAESRTGRCGTCYYHDSRNAFFPCHHPRSMGAQPGQWRVWFPFIDRCRKISYKRYSHFGRCNCYISRQCEECTGTFKKIKI